LYIIGFPKYLSQSILLEHYSLLQTNADSDSYDYNYYIIPEEEVIILKLKYNIGLYEDNIGNYKWIFFPEDNFSVDEIISILCELRSY